MAQTDAVFRILWLMDTFANAKKAYTLEEIKNKIEEHQDFNMKSYCSRNFGRDRDTLRSLFDMEIVYDKKLLKYRLTESSYEKYRFVGESLLLIFASKQLENQQEVMLFDKNKAKGTEHLLDLIEAIKSQKILTCTHRKYWDTIAENKVLEPYALKEFENRWYLLAMDRNKNDGLLRTYGLDRISDLELSHSSFVRKEIAIEKAFENSFGIISSLGQEPETIVLSFDAEQGKYIKALPLHASQRILVDNAEELQIELKLVPSYDFYQELLKQAGRMKILAPESVRKHFVELLKKAMVENEN